jgi:hypothetical protein
MGQVQQQEGRDGQHLVLLQEGSPTNAIDVPEDKAIALSRIEGRGHPQQRALQGCRGRGGIIDGQHRQRFLQRTQLLEVVTVESIDKWKVMSHNERVNLI